MSPRPGPSEAQTAFERFQERLRYSRQVRAEMLENLGSILEPPTRSKPHVEGSPLMLAARAVGEALGVSISPPHATEAPSGLEEPFEAMARASHLRVRRVRLVDNWWRRDSGPMLAYLGDGEQPVALLPVSATRYDLYDPLQRTRTRVNLQLASTLAPIAYTVYRPFPIAVRRWVDLFKFSLQGCGADLRLAFVMGGFATILGMLMPQVMGLLIDYSIPNADRAMIFQLGAALLAAATGQALFQLVQGVSLMRQNIRSGAALQAAMWDRLLQVTPAFFRQYTTGDLQARVTAATSIQQRLSGVTLQVLVTSGLALLNLGLMFYYHAPLALVACAVSIVASCITAVAAIRTVRYLRPLQRLSGEIVGTVVQLINGVAKLRVAGAEERAFAYWGKDFRAHQALSNRVQYIEDGVAVMNTMLPALASVVLFGGAMRTLQHSGPAGGDALTAGAFLAFYMAFGVLMSGATRLSNMLMDLLDVAMLWERAKPIVTAPVEVDPSKTNPGRLTGKLTVDAVTFRYQEGGAVALNEIRIQVAPGEFIALVGPSGSGKSTLLRLLLGFDAPEVGAVYYDDQDLSHLDVTAVRRQIGTVLQQSMIMAGSIFENIAAGGLITQDDAWEAAQAAGLADEIAAMPMQINTYVNTGGSNLSGGQRQRLLIARALVRKPTIMLLDEATSALDNRTQAIVTASLEQLQATRVIVAHRLSTIRQADRIYVLDRGRVVQEGNFSDLARQDGLFACLMARQEV